MPELTLNDENQLVDGEGNVFTIGEGDDAEPVTVKNAMTQERTNEIVKERLAKERKRLADLEEAAKENPKLRDHVAESEKRIQELEQQAEEAKSQAEEQARIQQQKLSKELSDAKAAAERNAQALVEYQVRTSIVSAAAEKFNDPGTDLVPHFLGAHKREEVKDDQGKGTGEFKDYFKLSWEEDGEKKVDFLELPQALDVWGKAHPHHLRASNAGGSGGGKHANYTGNKKRSEMSTAEKVAFTREHGHEAFQSLPE